MWEGLETASIQAQIESVMACRMTGAACHGLLAVVAAVDAGVEEMPAAVVADELVAGVDAVANPARAARPAAARRGATDAPTAHRRVRSTTPSPSSAPRTGSGPACQRSLSAWRVTER